MFWGALVNLILNAIFIPAIGINGAAIATLIAQIIVAIVAPGFYRDTRTSVKHMMDAIFLKGIK